jgi:hypothetical protein
MRRIEATVEKGADEGLVAYDGFENQAGRIQRDRSGFGWAGGWEPLGMRGRSSIGTIVEAPDDAAFGIGRVGLRQLRLSEGDAVRRDLERALPLEPGRVYYVSFIATRHPVPASSDGSLQVSICDDDRQRGHRARNEFALGVSSDGYPFLKTGGKVILSAPGIANNVPCLMVGKVVLAKDSSTETYLRVYQAKDNVDQHEPPAWSASGTSGPILFDLSRIRITTGTAAVFDIDELRLGRTWESVVAPRRTEE